MSKAIMNSDVPSFILNFWGFFENAPLLCKKNHFASRKACLSENRWY